MVEAYPWQDSAWKRLTSRNNYAHAYLLHGPIGIGKRALSERFMASLLCHGQINLPACGECKSCLLLKADSHPDIYLLEPEDADKAIKVDQVRNLVSFVAQTAQMGWRKVVLIEPVEAMNINAANALLKSLEEPSGNTVFLLVSHQFSRLLPTIRSRCIQQACQLPSKAMSLQWLAKVLPECSEDQRVELLTLVSGSPLAAVKMHAQGVCEQRILVVDGVKKLLKRELFATQLAESTWKDIPLLLLFDWFYDWSSLIIRYQLTHDKNYLGLSDMRKVVQYLSQKSAHGKVLNIQDWILAQRQKVLDKANLNRVLLLEALLVQWVSLPGRR
ncbi:DNA polymerase III subunit delta' [Candidatus Pseudomonas adelgestsugas]|uniref:DNA polymerase III subunit delta' n=1 Tax=Candidatus Pseudomonas adelgestsugas TaxID=1302376 RepID=A0ABX5R958_9PSED|nr:DNA polymerase III subunit delta' [Candidatus Pseudomonas adelgestsugas]QAX82182.1 DNA polymerase III subunit delta' [Candidatus Pseudomonas adelgestsugas]